MDIFKKINGRLIYVALQFRTNDYLMHYVGLSIVFKRNKDKDLADHGKVNIISDLENGNCETCKVEEVVLGETKFR